MYLTADDPFFTSGVQGYVAVPVPAAEVIRLHSADGDTLASAYRRDGCYVRGYPVTDDTLLYRDWRECLRDQMSPALLTETAEALEGGW